MQSFAHWLLKLPPGNDSLLPLTFFFDKASHVGMRNSAEMYILLCALSRENENIWWTALMTTTGLFFCWPFRRSLTIRTMLWNNWVQARSAQVCLCLLSWNKDPYFATLFTHTVKLSWPWISGAPGGKENREVWVQGDGPGVTTGGALYSELYQPWSDCASVLFGSGKGIWLLCDLGKSSGNNLNVLQSEMVIPARYIEL